MENRKTENESKREISPFYSTIFFSKRMDGLSPRRARAFMSGGISRALESASRSIAYSSTRAYGSAFLAFGIVSLLLHLVKLYFVNRGESVSLSSLIISAVFALISIPLLLSEKPLCRAIQDFAFTDYIFFEFFAIKRMNEHDRVKGLPIIAGVTAGIVPAIVSVFLGVEPVVLIIFGIVFFVLSFVSPEFPLMFLLLTTPYLSIVPYSDVVFITISALAVLSFFRKVLLGKRYYVFGISDIMILLFSVVILIAEIVNGQDGYLLRTVALIAVTLMYIPAANIIVNRRLADCAENAVIFSALPISLYAIIQYIVGGASSPATAFMPSSTALALFLSVAAVFIIFALQDMKRSVQSAIYAAMLCLCLLAIIATECVFVPFILLVCSAAYPIIMNRWLPNELLLPFLAIPIALYFIPDAALAYVSEKLSLDVALADMDNKLFESFDIFIHNAFIGVGAKGVNSFDTLFGIVCRFGVFAFAILAIALVVRLRQISVYSKFTVSSSLVNLCGLSTLAIFAMLAFGWFFDIFSSVSLYCLFSVLFGMNTAALRISKHEYDDRVYYYGDQRSFDSSDATITLRG
ncbi:MAG: hypothetical protein IJ515_05470 [Clostridia bacterium]|nr:hypothetical protein [Clostridia bacterium]